MPRFGSPRNRTVPIVLAAALSILSASPAAHAGLKQFHALLNAGQETPPNPSPGFGVAHLTYDPATSTLCYSITYGGLLAAEVLAHIHGPAAPGTPAGVVLALPVGNPKAGCVVAPPAPFLKSELFKNLYYLNIHTAAFPGGEIRGQILRIK
jgi:hypothetical protein